MHSVKEFPTGANIYTARIHHHVNENQVHLRLLVIQTRTSSITSPSKPEMPSWLDNGLWKESSNLLFTNIQKKMYSFLSENDFSGYSE